jgi:protein-tyrosine-phosphatase
MSMHLHHPSLSLTGKKKGKVKFRNAAEAQRARDLDASWKEILKSQGAAAEQKRRARAMRAEPLQYNLISDNDRAHTRHIPSLDTGHSGPVSSKENPKYTGTKILGIGTMHKSNAVPVFSDEEAHDIATMRRG